jgi:hypothetical protein
VQLGQTAAKQSSAQAVERPTLLEGLAEGQHLLQTHPQRQVVIGMMTLIDIGHLVSRVHQMAVLAVGQPMKVHQIQTGIHVLEVLLLAV